MKSVFTHLRIATATVLLVAGLLTQQTSASANSPSPLTPAQAAQFARDLIPSQSQQFFRQGQEMLEREIQILRKRQSASTESPLKIDVNTHRELERLPQLLLTNFSFQPKL